MFVVHVCFNSIFLLSLKYKLLLVLVVFSFEIMQICSLIIFNTCNIEILEPDTPSQVKRDWSVIFPGNSALRNVTVEWKVRISIY